MKSSAFAGMSLILLAGCTTDPTEKKTENTGGNPSATGGESSSGGATEDAVGGASDSGGDTSSSGGTSSTGGVSSGGTTSVGGSSMTSGGTTSSVFPCNNLRAAAGAPGQGKPAGAVGGLTVLDWAGFKGAVSFTFDDNNATQVANMSALKSTGAKMTFFIVSTWGNASDDAYKTAFAEGHEIGNHTSTHSQTGTDAGVEECQTFLQSTYGAKPFTMAAPYGNTSWSAPAGKFLIANRGVADGVILPRDSSDAFNLPAYLPPSAATSAMMDTAVNSARSYRAWKIFCVHGFDSSNGTYNPVPIEEMTATMSKAVKAGDLWVETMGNVTAYWLGQKAIPTTATTSATWTLPANFPPNMCVRVTTTGGTVKQNGIEIPWNDHGYYELSLDAKSVTLE
jgi:peptidoglycan/xylan/chitin deacetylase (PgdA/CDA1 family)